MFGAKSMDDTARGVESFAMASPGYDEQSMSMDSTMNTTFNTTIMDTTTQALTDRTVDNRRILDQAGHRRPGAVPIVTLPAFKQQTTPPVIRYPGEARAAFTKRLSESANDRGLQRVIGLQVPLARGLRVKPVDAGELRLALLCIEHISRVCHVVHLYSHLQDGIGCWTHGRYS
jgi:hypothetical protein